MLRQAWRRIVSQDASVGVLVVVRGTHVMNAKRHVLFREGETFRHLSADRPVKHCGQGVTTGDTCGQTTSTGTPHNKTTNILTNMT